MLAGAAAGYAQTRRTMSLQASTITGLSKNFLTMGWLGLLEHLRYNSDPTIPVVAWWDYGYWISVGGGHPSLADGATINSTQITLLAKAFTGSEDEASRIYRSLRLQPNHTLVLAHDMALYDSRNKALVFLYTLSTDDIKKAWAMHHIAGRDQNYLEFVNALARRDARTVNRVLRNTFILGMLVSAAYSNDRIVVYPPKLAGKLNVEVRTVDIGFTSGAPVVKVDRISYKHFKPYMVVIAPYMDQHGNLRQAAPGVYYVRVIAVYEWTG